MYVSPAGLGMKMICFGGSSWVVASQDVPDFRQLQVSQSLRGLLVDVDQVSDGASSLELRCEGRANRRRRLASRGRAAGVLHFDVELVKCISCC